VLRPLLKQALAPSSALPALAPGDSQSASRQFSNSPDSYSPNAMQFSHTGINGLPAPAPLTLSNAELDQRMNAVRLAASEDPRLVAQVVKTWVTPHDA